MRVSLLLLWGGGRVGHMIPPLCFVCLCLGNGIAYPPPLHSSLRIPPPSYKSPGSLHEWPASCATDPRALVFGVVSDFRTRRRC